MRKFFFVLATVLATCFTTSTFASDTTFFKNIQGEWSGPGEIVAGKYKGTKFVCTFGGTKPDLKPGMDVNGSCRVGVFSQPMNATVIKAAGSYIGAFLDGAKGDGMDVTGGRYTRDRLVVDIKRKDLNGIMVANLSNPNQLKVSVSVRHNNKIIPVLGMTLARQSDPIVTGSVK